MKRGRTEGEAHDREGRARHPDDQPIPHAFATSLDGHPSLTQAVAVLLDNHSASSASDKTCLTELHLATLKAALTCPLCGDLLTDDPVVIETCGHCFCDKCINSAVEDGCVPMLNAWPWTLLQGQPDETNETREDAQPPDKEVGERTVATPRSPSMSSSLPPAATTARRRGALSPQESTGRASHQQRRKRVRFSCPLCLGPAYKWVLLKLPLMRDLCLEVRRVAPALEATLKALREPPVDVDELTITAGTDGDVGGGGGILGVSARSTPTSTPAVKVEASMSDEESMPPHLQQPTTPGKTWAVPSARMLMLAGGGDDNPDGCSSTAATLPVDDVSKSLPLDHHHSNRASSADHGGGEWRSCSCGTEHSMDLVPSPSLVRAGGASAVRTLFVDKLPHAPPYSVHSSSRVHTAVGPVGVFEAQRSESASLSPANVSPSLPAPLTHLTAVARLRPPHQRSGSLSSTLLLLGGSAHVRSASDVTLGYTAGVAAVGSSGGESGADLKDALSGADPPVGCPLSHTPLAAAGTVPVLMDTSCTAGQSRQRETEVVLEEAKSALSGEVRAVAVVDDEACRAAYTPVRGGALGLFQSLDPHDVLLQVHSSAASVAAVQLTRREQCMSAGAVAEVALRSFSPDALPQSFICLCRCATAGEGDGGPLRVVERVTPAIATALVRGQWCVDFAWLCDCVTTRQLRTSAEAMSAYAVRGFIGAVKKSQCSGDADGAQRHNAFEDTFERLSANAAAVNAEEVAVTVPGQWMRDQHAFLVLPDAVVAEIVTAVASEAFVKDSFQDANDMTGRASLSGRCSIGAAQGGAAGWRRLVLSAGAHAVEVSAALLRALFKWGLRDPVRNGGSRDHDEAAWDRLAALMEAEEEEVAGGEARGCGSGGGAAAAPACWVHVDSISAAQPPSSVMLLYDRAIVKTTIQMICQRRGATLSPESSQEYQRSESTVTVRVREALYEMAKGLAILLSHGSCDEASSRNGVTVDADARTTVWLLKNIGENRRNAGRKAALTATTSTRDVEREVVTPPLKRPPTTTASPAGTTDAPPLQHPSSALSAPPPLPPGRGAAGALRSLLYSSTP